MCYNRKVLWIIMLIALACIALNTALPLTGATDDCSNAAESMRPCTRIELLDTLTEEFYNLNRYGLRSLKELFIQVLSDDAFYKAPHTERLHQHKANMWRLIDAASAWLHLADMHANSVTTISPADERMLQLELLVPGLRLMSEFHVLQQSYNTTNAVHPPSADVLLVEQLLHKYGLPQLLEELNLLLASFTHNFYKLVERYLNSLGAMAHAREHEMADWYELNKQEKFGDFGKFFKLYHEDEVLQEQPPTHDSKR